MQIYSIFFSFLKAGVKEWKVQNFSQFQIKVPYEENKVLNEVSVKNVKSPGLGYMCE